MLGTVLSTLHIIIHLIPTVAVVVRQGAIGARRVTPNPKGKRMRERLLKLLNYHPC